MLRVALALLLAACAAGCRKNDTVSCRETAKAFVTLARAELEEEGDEQAAEEAEAGLPALESKMIEACEAQGWSEALRTCVARAEGPEELERCDRYLSAGDAATGGT